MDLHDMDAGELREWLTEKYAFGFSSAYCRLVVRAERRMAMLLRVDFEQIRPEIVEDARNLREDTK